MTTWRMSFRDGNQGLSLWPQCYELGVAAITYAPFTHTDLSRHAKGQPTDLWAKIHTNQKSSLRYLAYEMKKGDIIYVKEGPRIINKGTIQGPYGFDQNHRLRGPDEMPWPHQVPVKWAGTFAPTEVSMRAKQLTVLQLRPNEVAHLETKIRKTDQRTKEWEALEAQIYKRESTFRRRNRTLINAKKVDSDYRCEICGFKFEEGYGPIGEMYIVAHHLERISSQARPVITTLKDLALVCANCHAMVHKKNPPIRPQDLREMIKHAPPARSKKSKR